MTSLELITQYHRFCEQNGWERIQRSSVINDANPTAFNYSMEEPILRKYGGFFTITAPWAFSTVQPCIRTGDFGRLKKTGDDLTHMTLFHMLPIAFSIAPDHSDYEARHKAAILKPLSFLTERLRLDIKRIKVSYFSGGHIRDVSRGRISSNLTFPPDELTRRACIEAGMTEEQLIPELSTNTLLCTSPVAGDFYAGYRYELYYQLQNGALIEIGTGESLEWKQLVQNGVTTDIVPMEQTICLSVVGLERCLIASGNLTTIAQCDHIKPILEYCQQNAPSYDYKTAFLFVDSLRTMHLVIADGGVYNSLNHRLREHARALLRVFTSSQDSLHLSEDQVRKALLLNAEKQSWLPELAESVERTMKELTLYRGRQ